MSVHIETSVDHGIVLSVFLCRVDQFVKSCLRRQDVGVNRSDIAATNEVRDRRQTISIVSASVCVVVSVDGRWSIIWGSVVATVGRRDRRQTGSSLSASVGVVVDAGVRWSTVSDGGVRLGRKSFNGVIVWWRPMGTFTDDPGGISNSIIIELKYLIWLLSTLAPFCSLKMSNFKEMLLFSLILTRRWRWMSLMFVIVRRLNFLTSI